MLTLGDITNGDTDPEWRRVQEAFTEVDGKVPYVLVAGNHDYTPHGNTVSGKSGMNKYFPSCKFKDWPTFGGMMKDGDITNSYHLFSAGGIDWIVLALEWGPRPEDRAMGQRHSGQVSSTQGDPCDTRLSLQR